MAPAYPATAVDHSGSKLQGLLQSSGGSDDAAHERRLALQVAHNLKYQHDWRSLRLHGGCDGRRPLLSGLPPHRIYVHPDEQIELLQQQKAAGKTGMPDLGPHREWVLPSHLRERWSLSRFGAVFDSVSPEPPDDEGDSLFPDDPERAPETDVTSRPLSGDVRQEDWRRKLPTRLLLATVDDDSTIVYYIVHDGIVKPRQN